MIGASPARVGGRDRVTGHLAYVADIHLEGELHVRLVTVDHARARILSIDTTAALSVPGVHAVLTAADLPQPMDVDIDRGRPQSRQAGPGPGRAARPGPEPPSRRSPSGDKRPP